MATRASAAEIPSRGVPFAAWLLQIARNALTDRWQRSARERGEPASDPDEAASPPDVDRRAMLADLVARLPHDQQRVVVARFVEQQTMEPPTLQPYGERRAAVRDAFDNQWYLAAPVR